jgi:hypothetical protein
MGGWEEYINQQVISKEEKLDVGDDSGVFRDVIMIVVCSLMRRKTTKKHKELKVLSRTPVFSSSTLVFSRDTRYKCIKQQTHGRSEKYSCSKQNAHGRNMILK